MEKWWGFEELFVLLTNGKSWDNFFFSNNKYYGLNIDLFCLNTFKFERTRRFVVVVVVSFCRSEQELVSHACSSFLMCSIFAGVY